jgi:hypothetical protein
MKRHAVLFLFFIIAFWFGVGSVSAVTLEEKLDEEFNLSMTPEERSREWHLALAKFAVRKPKMSRDQAEAILALMDIKDTTFFEHSPDPEKREILSKQLSDFGAVFSYNDVLEFLLPFQNLRLWLGRNKLLASVDLPDCNCDWGGDCTSGYSCKSVRCVHPEGTDHIGVCMRNLDIDFVRE